MGVWEKQWQVQWIDWWNSSRRCFTSVWLRTHLRWTPVNSELTGETPVVDRCHQSIHWVIVSLRTQWLGTVNSLYVIDWHPSTTGVSPVNELFLSDSSRRWVSERNNDRYSELTGETPVVDGCLRETMTGTVSLFLSDTHLRSMTLWWNSSRRWYLSLFLSERNNDRYSELTGETPVVDGVSPVSVIEKQWQVQWIDWWNSSCGSPVSVSLRHPENPSTMDTSQQWIDWWNSSRRWVSERNNDRYSELTGETPVVDGCLRETMTGTVNWLVKLQL